MRWFINYIRQCFCKHEFDTEEYNAYRSFHHANDIKVITTCKKCTYHKSYWKIY